MPFGSITLRPGVNSVFTPTLNEAGISDSDLIRFRFGLPEKLGGWTRWLANPETSITKDLHAWQALDGDKWLAIGNLGTASGGALNVAIGAAETDITPDELTTSEPADFTTTAGSRSVVVMDTNITDLPNGSAVFFNTPVSVGGILLTGFFTIQDASGSTFTIQSVNPAVSSVSNGGSVPAFSTLLDSNVVTVTFADHGLGVGSLFEFPIPTIVGGLTIDGVYSVKSVISTNQFTIEAASSATSTDAASMNGGEVSFLYYIGIGGLILTSEGAGFIGPVALGQVALGQGYVTINASPPQEGDPLTTSDWSLDNWGEILLANPKGGPIFYWQPDTAAETAIPIGSAPPFNNGIFVSMPQLILVAWGSARSLASQNRISEIDPLLVRWSDSLNFLEWRARIDTQAGSFRLSTGSLIVGAIQAAKTAYLFTDIGVWTMEYIGYPLVFGFEEIGQGCGLLGPHAVCKLRGAVYWVSNDNFYVTTGGEPQPIPCSVWDTIFQDLDTANQTKVVAAPNSRFNEIFFFYPSISGGTGECDKYVKYNVLDGVWDKGTMSRSAWTDETILGPPIGADPDTLLLQQHETSYNADGSAMTSFFETGNFAIGDGENFAVIDHFQPDSKFTTVNSSTPGAQVDVTITGLKYPNDASGLAVSGPLTMTSTTEYLTPRVRGRLINFRVESSDSGSWWRWGQVRYRYAPDGQQ